MRLQLKTKHRDDVIVEHASSGWVKIVLIDDHIGAVHVWLSEDETVQMAEFLQDAIKINLAGRVIG